MNIIDISWPLKKGMTTYKNREDYVVASVKTWQEHTARESRITLSTHVGTHVDAPSHFIETGATIDAIPLNTLCGPCIVLDVTDIEESIDSNYLEKCSITAKRILFKTRNSQRNDNDRFDQNFIYLAASGADYLHSIQVACVGIDYLGIERNQPDHETHDILLRSQIGLIEGLRLGHVAPGEYTLICLPIGIVGLDAAPARAVLLAH